MCDDAEQYKFQYCYLLICLKLNLNFKFQVLSLERVHVKLFYNVNRLNVSHLGAGLCGVLN